MLNSAVTLTKPALYVLAGIFSCDPAPAAQININLQISPPQIDNSKDRRFLKTLQNNSSSPRYDYNGRFTIVTGITSSNIKAESDLHFYGITNPLLNKTCLQIKEVNIKITYDPVVYITKDYLPGSCDYNLTHEHEMRHVSSYIKTINEFVPYINEVAALNADNLTKTDAIDSQDIESEQRKISQTMSGSLGKAFASMTHAINLQQINIDTPAEYERLSGFCAGRRGF